MNGSAQNARDNQRSHTRLSWGDVRLDADEEPLLASHLVCARWLYTHHGIYVGNGYVVHYAGLAIGLRRGPVEQVSLERFAHGRSVWIQSGERRFDRCQVVDRALSRLGESQYRILTNNCEHFCEWALRDESCSRQIERLRAVPRLVGRAISSVSRLVRQFLSRNGSAIARECTVPYAGHRLND